MSISSRHTEPKSLNNKGVISLNEYTEGEVLNCLSTMMYRKKYSIIVIVQTCGYLQIRKIFIFNSEYFRALLNPDVQKTPALRLYNRILKMDQTH
jgi:predicted type IV restriction endonuclease